MITANKPKTHSKEFDAEILGAFRKGFDTLDIAQMFGLKEAQVVGFLHSARERELAA